MTVQETIMLLNLLAVVIFGVINITKRNNRPHAKETAISQAINLMEVSRDRCNGHVPLVCLLYRLAAVLSSVPMVYK